MVNKELILEANKILPKSFINGLKINQKDILTKQEETYITELINAYKRFLSQEILSSKDVTYILGYNSKMMKQLKQILNVKQKFKKADIEFILSQQQEIGTTYLTSSMISKQYGFLIYNCRFKRIGVKLPLFLNNKNMFIYANKVYPADKVEEYVEKIQKKNYFYNTEGNSEFETFIIKLNLHYNDLSAFNLSPYTKEVFILFAKTKMNLQINAKHSSKITRFLSVSTLINDLLTEYNVADLSDIKTAQMIFYINTKVNKTYRITFIKFLEFFTKYMANKNNKTNFSLADIKKSIIIENKIVKPEKIETYSTDEYFAIYNYALETKYHCNKAIKEIIQTNEISYLSTWFYIMMHLNNSWRNGDIIDFPRLPLKDILDELKIYNIEWFNDNILPIKYSAQIISRVSNYSYLFSKTENYGHFFCADDLFESLSTALLMLECYWQYHSKKEFIPEYNESVLNFANSQGPSKKQQKDFFKNFTISNFKFSSKKMNKTVMTLVYNTATQILPSGYNALLLPKYMRAHVEDASTVNYINFSEKELYELSGKLFKRGEFGYIYDTLLKVISDKPKNNAEIDTEINLIKNNFGDVRKIESVATMLNSVKAERTEVIKMIEDYGYEKCNSIIEKIYLNNLPSKNFNIQCLFSEYKCLYPELNCVDCKYSIPNIYILQTVCKSMMQDIENYLITQNLSQQIKLSNKIHRKILLFMDAIDKYGKDYVYGFLDISRDDFIKIFNTIPEVDELIALL